MTDLQLVAFVVMTVAAPMVGWHLGRLIKETIWEDDDE